MENIIQHNLAISAGEIMPKAANLPALEIGSPPVNDTGMTTENHIIHFAQTNFRNEFKKFGIKQADRLAHMYIIGKTGTGKSTLLETLIKQDIESGQGVALLDPHGDLAERVLARISPGKRDRLIFLDLPNPARPLGFNPLQRVPAEKRALAASGLLEAFEKIWADSWGPRLEHILRNALLALLDQPQAALADILRLLDDKDFRRTVALNRILTQSIKIPAKTVVKMRVAKAAKEAIVPGKK